VIGETRCRYMMQDSRCRIIQIKEIEAVTFWFSEPTYTYYSIRYINDCIKNPMKPYGGIVVQSKRSKGEF
jgi:hypothetical protein